LPAAWADVAETLPKAAIDTTVTATLKTRAIIGAPRFSCKKKHLNWMMTQSFTKSQMPYPNVSNRIGDRCAMLKSPADTGGGGVARP
jgi:hypothetical protein